MRADVIAALRARRLRKRRQRAALRDRTPSYDDCTNVLRCVAPISAVGIAPYYGNEIPNWRGLGLEPDELYQMLRDPDELANAATSFRFMPILPWHIPAHIRDVGRNAPIVGRVRVAEFQDPYLLGDLEIWDADALADIASGDKRGLSIGYHYVADMTPGMFEGEKYDGVIRSIEGRHVALVWRSRAGRACAIPPAAEFARAAA